MCLFLPCKAVCDYTGCSVGHRTQCKLDISADYSQPLAFTLNVHSVIIRKPCIIYRAADKSLARPTFRCILFDGENISFDASFVIYINSTNIPPIMIINRIYEYQNLLSLQLVSFLVGLRTYQHPCIYSFWKLKRSEAEVGEEQCRQTALMSGSHPERGSLFYWLHYRPILRLILTH